MMNQHDAILEVLYEKGDYSSRQEWHPYVSLRRWSALRSKEQDTILEYGYTGELCQEPGPNYAHPTLPFYDCKVLTPGRTNAELVRVAIRTYDDMEREARAAEALYEPPDAQDAHQAPAPQKG